MKIVPIVMWPYRPVLLSLTFISLLLSLGAFSSSADVNITNQPTSQDRSNTPAGELVLDATTRQPAVAALPVNFLRSPDHTAPDGHGRYLIAVNSGFGLQFSGATNRAQQSLSVIDLNARPKPIVIQNIYFPTPQSVNVGVVFAPQPDADGSYRLYASGGVENRIWIFRFQPGGQNPITPTSPGPDTEIKAPFIDVSGFTRAAPSARYNGNRAPVYPTGLAISEDGERLFVANNLGDSLGVISELNGARTLERIDLSGQNGNRSGESLTYPYGVVAIPIPAKGGNGGSAKTKGLTSKVYVSCWNDSSVAVIDLANHQRRVSYIPVARHPTAMVWDSAAARLYVVNSDADSVSVIDTGSNREVERINVRLAEKALQGGSPEGLALSDDGRTLYVANAHSNSVAVVSLSAARRGDTENDNPGRSMVRGLIPTGNYPSAVAIVNGNLFIGNGKGTGFENSSVLVNNSGFAPNIPNDRFPVGRGRGGGQGGQYSVSLVSGNISLVAEPDERSLASYTQQVMRNNGLLGGEVKRLFPEKSPIKHIIYVIKENRTYDQVFGDVERAGNGQPADGDPALAIFGAGDTARLPNGPAQNITPNHHALAMRFGLFDRFFVNSEASPDGHNWSTAAFSNDYVDKAYRWEYSGRGRTYDYEGFNRLPDYEPSKEIAPLFQGRVEADDIANYMRLYIPYLQGARDVAEPETLYLWDAVARAGLSYRNYGEFVATISAADVEAVNSNRAKTYPDISPTVSAFPTKKTLENHHSAAFRNFDLNTPDSMTVESYRVAKGSGGKIDPLVSNHNSEVRFRGASRLGAWLDEFQGYVDDLNAGRGDHLPNLSMMRLSNDHTAGLAPGKPTPQFFVADNDYAIGRLAEAVSNSPYWKDTAIFMVEDDAQDGPDHVDAHRSVALVISAYNRPGALVHEFHSTVSLIRTMEILLGLEPMNQLDASAVPMDLFQSETDLRPFKALFPEVALDNLVSKPRGDVATRKWIRRTAEQDMTHADMADPGVLNQIIWFSVRRESAPMPEVARLPLFDAMRIGIIEDEGKEREEVAKSKPMKSRHEKEKD
jgi:YVTN family beta-propeller protein